MKECVEILLAAFEKVRDRLPNDDSRVTIIFMNDSQNNRISLTISKGLTIVNAQIDLVESEQIVLADSNFRITK